MKCIICGKELSGKQKRFCSKKCSKKQNNKDYYERNRKLSDSKASMIESEVERRKKRKKIPSLSEISKAAKEHGMDYGEYVMFLEKQKEMA